MADKYDICCIIMASGLSKRMGNNKLLMDIEGKRIFENSVDALEKSDIAKKVIVTAYDEIINYASKYDDFKIVKNERNFLGQSESIKLGVKEVKDCDGYMFLPADMPFVNSSLLNEIAAFFYKNNDNLIVPRVGGKNSMPTIFPAKYREALLNVDGDVGGRDILRQNLYDIRYINIKDENILRDMDTKEDFESLKNL